MLELSAGHGAARTVGPVGYWGDHRWFLISTEVLGVGQWGENSDSQGRAASGTQPVSTQGQQAPSPELGCAGVCSPGMQPGMAARDPGRAMLQGIRPHGGWQSAGRAWWRVQDPSLFTWVFPHGPLCLHVPERSDVLVGGHLLHLQPLQQRQGGWDIGRRSSHSTALGTPCCGPSQATPPATEAASDRERGWRWLEVGCWMLGVGVGCWVLDVGCWM